MRIVLAIVVLVASIAVIVVSREDEQTPAPLLGDVQRVLEPDYRRASITGETLPLEPKRPGNQAHYHFATRFITDGVPILPPREVGRTVRGYLALHTHDQSGIVHAHQPLDGPPFRLADLWRAWGLTVTPTSFAGLAPYCVYVNGRRADGGWRLRDRDDVQIEFAACGERAPLEPFDFESVDFYAGEDPADADDPQDAIGAGSRRR